MLSNWIKIDFPKMIFLSLSRAIFVFKQNKKMLIVLKHKGFQLSIASVIGQWFLNFYLKTPLNSILEYFSSKFFKKKDSFFKIYVYKFPNTILILILIRTYHSTPVPTFKDHCYRECSKNTSHTENILQFGSFFLHGYI